MFANRRLVSGIAAGVSLAAVLIILPASAALTAQMGEAPKLSYDLPLDMPMADADTPTQIAAAPIAASAPSIDRESLECMSKVVHHEAKGQPRRGQIAVAQALLNRLHAGRFGDSICAVVAQRGQFFNVASYSPRRDTDDWQTAQDVSREALNGAEQVAPGAIFFRASYAPANSFFRTRQRVATIGGHIFYR